MASRSSRNEVHFEEVVAERNIAIARILSHAAQQGSFLPGSFMNLGTLAEQTLSPGRCFNVNNLFKQISKKL